jgi:non-homologous end joining protein Ku
MIMLEPLGKGLLGTFDYEVRSEKEYFSHIPSPRIGKDMILACVAWSSSFSRIPVRRKAI